MNDRELERLIGMALEAEGLERSAAGSPPLRLVGASGGVRRWATGLGIATAAAASLVAAMIIMQNQLISHQAGRQLAGGQPHPHVGPVESSGSSSGSTGATGSVALTANDKPGSNTMLMAVFRNSEGQCSCMQVNPHTWTNGRHLADVDRRELIDAAMNEACTVNPHQVLVVAVEGSSNALLQSREQVEAIATKLSEVPGRHADLTSYAYEAIPGLPRDATVVAERVSVRPVSPLKAAAEQVRLPVEFAPSADVH